MKVQEVSAAREQRGRPFPPGVSGNPLGSRVVKVKVEDRARDLLAAIVAEVGELPPADAMLARQACLLIARSERMKRRVDADASTRMSQEARRILEPICERGRQRKARERQSAGPLLPEYSPLDFNDFAQQNTTGFSHDARQRPSEAVQRGSGRARRSATPRRNPHTGGPRYGGAPYRSDDEGDG